MKVLVTGATGFLGTTLCRRLTAQCDDVTAVGSRECDLTCGDSLAPIRGERFDRIYHLAAWTQAGDFCLFHPGEQWVVNQKINANMLSWWQSTQPQAKLICIGTSCAYDPDLPLSEENYLDGTPIESLFTYAMTKRMLLIGLRALSKQYGLKGLCVVPSTLYGPGYPLDGRQMHFIFDLVRKIVRGKSYGEPVVLWGDGHQRRELVHVDDFVTAMLALDKKAETDLVNIGSGEEFSIRHFAELICSRLDFDFGRISFDETKYVGAKSKCLEVSKLRALLPDHKFRALEDGLYEIIDDFWLRRDNLPGDSK